MHQHHEPNHLLQFYHEDQYLAGALAHFILEGLENGEGIALICTPSHWQLVQQELEQHPLFASALINRQLKHLDARETLDRFLMNGKINQTLFSATVHEVFDSLSARFERLRFFGEMVDLLCADGSPDLAHELEVLWNGFLAKNTNCTLLCGYATRNVESVNHRECICATHLDLVSEQKDEFTQNDQLFRRIAELEIKLATGKIEKRGVQRDLNQAKTKLIQMGKLSAVGELFAGLAHEINNPLAVLLANLCQLRKTLNPALDSDVDKKLTRAERALDRVTQTVKNVLRLSHPNSGPMERVRLQTLVHQNIDSMCDSLKSDGINIHTSFQLEDVWCLGDFTTLTQVMLNLITNARDAILATNRSSGTIGIEVFSRDKAVGFCVSDDGVGMDQTTMDKMFLPFFTTKTVGQGTGLGLSLAYTYVRSMGGEIQCTSELGQGSRFCVTLPCAPMN